MMFNRISIMPRGSFVLACTIFALLLSLLAGSCRKSAVAEDYRRLNHSAWNQDTALVFELNVPDPKKIYNLSFTVRNEGRYSYSNLWLFVTIETPAGKEMKDTIELTLANPTGEWLGSGLGDLYEWKYPFKQSIFFPELGTYTISVSQGMRTTDGILNGIHDFGIILEKGY